MTSFENGSVWLVGAGPGDPELLTRKAYALIQAADVIFHDALVSEEILKLAPARARTISVGKRAGRHSKDQKSIDTLIVQAALAGGKIVRLKGGDPAIFGRATEELDACQAAGVSVQICPGITAASGAAASLGASLTLRGMARKLTFVTAHTKRGEGLDLDWQTLADPKATLAVYMGKAAAQTVSRQLIAAGLSPATPVALVENATLHNECQFFTTLDLLPLASKAALGDGPALLLIGEAMRQSYVSNGKSAMAAADKLTGN